MAMIAGILLLSAAPARAQRSGDFSMTYTQESARFVGQAPNPYFYLRGATVELGYSLWKGFGATVGGTGLAGTNLRGSIDIHQVSLLVGPRYTWNIGHITPTTWDRKGGIFAEGKFGYTFASSGQYPSHGVLTSSSSALDLEAGGGVNFHVYHRFDLRLIEGDFVRTQLPNGSTNVQNSFRIASGINFHIGY
ncbi:MAG TPA: hypothetical protein VHY48_12255 [Acidobacteriaceae bacterium]|jgi:hypothetical protein|nr:hypothetical protein [Acidobacteriaceae bacterium]